MVDKNFKIGDRVKILSNKIEDEIGTIVGTSDPSKVTLRKVVPGNKVDPEFEMTWWKVEIDGKGETRDCPDDILELI
jgi:hypothetical protein